MHGWRTAFLRWVLWGLAAIIVASLGGTVRAQGAARIDDRVCAFYAPMGADPWAIIASPPPPCNKRLEQPRGRMTYALFSGLSAKAQPGDPLEFSYRIARADFQNVYFRYADGQILSAPNRRDDAVRPFAPNDLYFRVPYRPVALETVLVQSKGYENAVGVATRASLATASHNRARSTTLHLGYGLFGGAMIAILAYNIILWWALRYQFLFTYCLLGATMLFFGASWSGFVMQLSSDLTVNGQVALNLLAFALIVALLPVFLFSFLERESIPARLKTVTLASGAIAVVASLLRLGGVDSAWRLLDIFTYGGILASLALITLSSLVAAVRGSRAVRYFLFAWTIPLAFAAYRTMWAVGLIGWDGALMDISPFGVMALEMLLTSVGIGARIKDLREERDNAQAMRVVLQHLADTDSLTGLLNRRAFLEQAHRRSGEQRLILIDVDRFKAVNDQYGHEAGDSVLEEIARLLRTNSPPNALIGRLGGEEFAVLVDDEMAPLQLGETLLLTIGYAPMPSGSRVTASAGEASGGCCNHSEWRLLYKRADKALYVAKAAGRNCLRRDGETLAA